LADIIARRYRLSPFSNEVKEILECPYKREIVIAIINNVETEEMLLLRQGVKVYELTIKELYKLLDIQMTTYINMNRSKNTSPIKSIFQSQETQQNAPVLLQFKKD
jgi:hypothetical protein